MLADGLLLSCSWAMQGVSLRGVPSTALAGLGVLISRTSRRIAPTGAQRPTVANGAEAGRRFYRDGSPERGELSEALVLMGDEGGMGDWTLP